MSDNEILYAFVMNILSQNPEVSAMVFADLLSNMLGTEVAVNEPEPEENWYDQFRSENTTVKVTSENVQVTIARGHADEWKHQLKMAGFRWSKKNRNYWAPLDDDKRAETARRNRENYEATKDMTPEERRAYWANRRNAA